MDGYLSLYEFLFVSCSIVVIISIDALCFIYFFLKEEYVVVYSRLRLVKPLNRLM